MKRILWIILALFIVNPVIAENIKVQALSDFSTANPSKLWRIKVVENFLADNGTKINSGTIIEGKIIDVISPKRLKRPASFTFVPQTYYDPQLGYTQDIKRDFKGKYSNKTDLTIKNVAKKGAITAGNILIGSFVAPTVGLVEGAVKNEDGNRAKSAVVSAYENTPLSYASKGKELEFKKGQIFIMNFKLAQDEAELNKPNYSYEIINK